MPGFAVVVGILAAITLVRLVGLQYSAVDLYLDEAQYWAWSRELAFGYFSKPPLIAWIIAAAERVCGSGEGCIRAPAPIFYFGTSLVVYALARQLYDDRIASFAALSAMLATGVVFSARIISTDVLLLFFWALALLAYVKLLAANRHWAVVLGIALGLGLLAKYAMIYFLLGAALAAWLDKDARRFLRTPAPWVALAIAALIITPNIIWNIENSFVTFKHTGDNIQGSGIKFNPVIAVEFIAAQFAVFGPVVFAVFVAAVFRISSREVNRADRLMLAFAIPPLALVTVTALVTHANANWAAPAFISAIVVATAILIRRGAWKWLLLSLTIGVFAQAVFLIGDARAPVLHLPWLANGDVYHRTLGGHALGDEAGRLARRVGARTIVAERRDDVASLLYYWRDQSEQVVAWPRGPMLTHQFELSRPLNEATPQPLVFITHCPSPRRLSAYFANVEPLGSFSTPTGPTSARTYHAFKLDGRRGPVGPLGACEIKVSDPSR